MIDPRYMGVVEWTDRTAATLPFPVNRLTDPKKWREWARNLIQYPQVSAFNPPDPAFFEDWREWVERLIQVAVTL